MKLENGLITAFFVAFALLFVFFIYSTVKVHANCDDGHVVKNMFDWPVCVKDGSK